MLLKEVIEGGMIGKRTRGRKMIAMLDLVKENSYREMKRKTEDRKGWREWMPRTCQEVEN